MRSPQNFFKHADRDPDAELEFNPEFTEYMLLDAMVTYARITGEIPTLFNAFSTWFTLQRPEKTNRPPEIKARLMKAKEYFGHLTRGEFLRLYLEDSATIRHRHGASA